MKFFSLGIVIVLCVLALSGCSPNTDSQLATTGLAGGDIRFENQSTAITNYLNSHTLQPDSGDSVKFYAPGSMFGPQSTTAYSVSGSADPVASYSTILTIDDADTFSVELSSLRFTGVGVY